MSSGRRQCYWSGVPALQVIKPYLAAERLNIDVFRRYAFHATGLGLEYRGPNHKLWMYDQALQRP
eukprot:1641917-Amphidinium_carterae.1